MSCEFFVLSIVDWVGVLFFSNVEAILLAFGCGYVLF